MSKRPHTKTGGGKETKEFEEEVLQIDRVPRVVKGGRRLRFRATVIIGNRKGKVGVGVGKSEEVVGAIQKAVADAKKNMITVILDGTTVPHQTNIKYKSAHVLLIPACAGTGIIAGGPVRKVVELAGIRNLLSKSLGTTNKISCARATIEALKEMKKTPFSKKPEFPTEADRPKQQERQRPPRRNDRRGPATPEAHTGPIPAGRQPVKTETPKAAPAPKAEAKPEPKPEEAPKTEEAPKPEVKPEPTVEAPAPKAEEAPKVEVPTTEESNS